VPEGFPADVPLDELESTLDREVPAEVKSIRGKPNVPRQRFWLTSSKLYRQAIPV
jgi:hypothetical protein